MNRILYAANVLPKTNDPYHGLMAPAAVEQARSFHRSFPQYTVTPLRRLAQMSRRLGLGGLYVKDESFRFGLNAFKVLGGSFAIGRYVAKTLNRSIEWTDYAFLTSDAFRRGEVPFTFFTATDGNHGRGIAWAARQLRQNAVVLMPETTTRSRFENIRLLGADVRIEPLNYDDCVRKAAALSAATPNSVVVQDTAWPGYEEIPADIMQGYGTLIAEACDQLAENGVDRPTHVFVQAGVGSLAAAVQGYLLHRYPEAPPAVLVMECRCADCFYRSATQGDGNAVAADGVFDSVMAGLCCGEVNSIAWDVLRNHAAGFFSCDDTVTAAGMRRLSSPMGDDPRVVSGESGALGMGVLDALCTDPALAPLREQLGLHSDAQVLLISTEGDTDPDRYRRIVWDGDLCSASL